MKLYQVDAFTDRPFQGNPACVCLLPAPRSEAWMSALAGEMNLSETAFVVEHQDGSNLRWFTPRREVSLCGHATLAAAHILWELGHLAPAEPARFDTLSGILTARRDGEWIEMDFPIRQVTPAEADPGVNRALGAEPSGTFMSTSSTKGHTYLLELASEEAVRALQPDFGALRDSAARVAIVTSRGAGQDYDFVSRFFAPAIGIDEDPVTGSAHCYLAPFWEARLGKRRLLGRQVSPRGGWVGCERRGERVALWGKAVTVLQAELAASAAQEVGHAG
jgi:PhzF family phenazine biosynthesis protein